MLRWVLLLRYLYLRPLSILHAHRHVDVSKLVIDLSVLHSVRRCSDWSLIVSATSTSIRLSQARLLRRRRGYRGRAGDTRIGSFWRGTFDCGFHVLFLLVHTVWLLLLRDIPSYYTQVPKHQVRDEDLLIQRSASIGELDMAQPVNSSLDVDWVPCKVAEAERCGRC